MAKSNGTAVQVNLMYWPACFIDYIKRLGCESLVQFNYVYIVDSHTGSLEGFFSIKAMERYKAVEIRWRTDLGKSKLELEIEVEKIKEQIRALRQQDRGRGGGGREMGRRGTGRR